MSTQGLMQVVHRIRRDRKANAKACYSALPAVPYPLCAFDEDSDLAPEKRLILAKAVVEKAIRSEAGCGGGFDAAPHLAADGPRGGAIYFNPETGIPAGPSKNYAQAMDRRLHRARYLD